MLTVLHEERPDFIDGVDDFKRLRWEAAVRLRQQINEKKREQSEIRAQARSAWQKDGASTLNCLQGAKRGVNAILGPHLLKKNCGLELLDWVRNFETSSERRIAYFSKKPYSVRLLYYIRPPFYLKGSKTSLIRWKWVVMKELRRFLDRSKYFTEGLLSRSTTTETKALRKMEYGQRSLVPLKPDDLAYLYKNRDQKRFHEDKRDVVHKLIEKWAKVPFCKSLLHSNPAGCPVCEVILMGGTREPILYVRAVNRQSGVETLEKLEQELIYLHKERDTEDKYILECKGRIEVYEKIMFKLARDSIQSWWTAVLARRRSLREDKRRRFSLFYYRIRRLCQMKKEIDNTIDACMDFGMLRIKYSEIVPELKEYMAKVAADRTDVGIKVGKTFIQKLRKAVARARRRKYMEEEMVMQEKAAAVEIVKKKKNAAALLAMRKLVRIIEKRKFICIREKCDGRSFFSVERYNAHMAVHRVEDAIRAKKILNDKLQLIRKEQEADAVTERIAGLRASVLDFAREQEELDNLKASRKNLIDPQSVDLGDKGYIKLSEWNAQAHMRIINQEKNAFPFYLQLISKRGDIEAPGQVFLNEPFFRFGTLPTNNCSFVCAGQSKRDGLVSKVHCVITMPVKADYDDHIRVHDNHSVYGTYIVSSAIDGAVKVTTSTTDGNILKIGDLLCIGVKKYGAAILDASEASSACMVYKVSCEADL
jgi:hypothetical protein